MNEWIHPRDPRGVLVLPQPRPCLLLAVVTRHCACLCAICLPTRCEIPEAERGAWPGERA